MIGLLFLAFSHGKTAHPIRLQLMRSNRPKMDGEMHLLQPIQHLC